MRDLWYAFFMFFGGIALFGVSCISLMFLSVLIIEKFSLSLPSNTFVLMILISFAVAIFVTLKFTKVVLEKVFDV